MAESSEPLSDTNPTKPDAPSADSASTDSTPTDASAADPSADNVDALLNAAGAGEATNENDNVSVTSAEAAALDAGDAVGAATDNPMTDQDAIDEILRQASFEDPSQSGIDPSLASAAGLDAQPLDLPNFQQVMQDAQVSSIDLLRDVDLNVKIELGRSQMLVEDVLKLSEGSVVELDKLAGDPVDVFVNDRLVARGEVLVLNDNFCVRINEIVAGVKEEGL